MCFRFTSFVEILLALSIIQQVEVYLKYTWSIFEVCLCYIDCQQCIIFPLFICLQTFGNRISVIRAFSY